MLMTVFDASDIAELSVDESIWLSDPELDGSAGRMAGLRMGFGVSIDACRLLGLKRSLMPVKLKLLSPPPVSTTEPVLLIISTRVYVRMISSVQDDGTNPI